MVDEPTIAPPVRITAAAPDRPRPTAADVDSALQALHREPVKVELLHYESLRDISRPGLYSWWIDGPGAEQLSRGLQATVEAGLIYVGQARATQWPSGKRRDATLRTRIATMHLGTKISFSTLRFTLAACLRDQLGLQVAGAKMLTPDSERALTDWMASNLQIAAFGYDEVDALDELEQSILDAIDPQLNLKHRPRSDLRQRLRTLRSALATGS